MADSAKVDGQEKVIAAAQQIVKSLATSKNAADDMIRILSGFDNRFSTIHNDNLFTTSDDPLASASASTIYADDFSVDIEDEEEEGQRQHPPRSPSDEAAKTRLYDAESVVLRWDATNSLLWDAASSDAVEEYFAAVDELIALTASHVVAGPLLGRAETALQMAMSRFEEEFRHLMARNSVPLDSNGLYYSIRRLSLSLSSDCGEPVEDFEIGSVDEEHQQADKQQDAGSIEERHGGSLTDEQNVELVNPDAVADLRAIADRMICGGYDRELHQVYCAVRVEILEESLSILGFERTSIEEVLKIEWKMLDDKMKKWIHAVKIVVRVLLSGERRLCDQILGASEDLKEVCFEEMAKGCIMQLLNFGDAIAMCQRSSEKLFRILDMYEALADVLPDMHELFSPKMKVNILEETDGNLKRLGDAVRGILMEFENAIRYELSRKPMLTGEIHPLIRYVMNYFRLLVDYNDSLDLILKDDEAGFGNLDHEGGHGGSMTPLGQRLYVLISYLESNLEEKSKVYEDGALQYIFLMNNILYIVHKIKDSELGRLLGDQWIRRRRSRIRQYATSYLRTSWTKVLSCLKDDGIGTGSGSGSGSGHGHGHGSASGSSHSVSKVALKERFKNFNLAFEEIYKVQTAWKVPDPQLREELRISISEKVIPAYRSFTGRFSGQLEGRHASKHIKYTADDLESYLSDLFEGVPAMTNHPRRKT